MILECSGCALCPVIITQFKALKLYGMAECYADLQNNDTPSATTYLDSSAGLLRQLLQAELTKRNIRSIRYQTNAARFLVQRNLQGFDFSQSKVDEQLIYQLATLAFTETAQNLVSISIENYPVISVENCPPCLIG